MKASSANRGDPSPTQTRTILKYAARGALGAILLYAVVGSSKHTVGNGVSQQYDDTTAGAPTYWSVPSAPEATVTPDPVKVVEVPASPEPEGLASPDSKSAAAVPPTSSGTSSDSPVAQPEGDGPKETILGENENIDEFLKRLFEEDGIPLPEDLKAPPPAQKPLSEDEKAEIERLKKVETLEKRADITGRHSKWEKKVKKAGEEELLDLMEKVTAMRKGVVDRMRTNPEMFHLLKTMQEDGFKQVENTDKYLQKMTKNGEKSEEASSKWTKIVAAVQKRLDSRVIEVTTYLQKWYKDNMQKEKEVFEASADRMDKLADDAQADIGMDYAWLDDVTTDDWSRYHKLKDDAKGWIEQFETVYNATHVDMLENIVVTELIQVETAMTRVAADLNQALDQVRMRGDHWLKGEAEPAAMPSASTPDNNEPAETEQAAPSPVGDVEDSSTIPVPETSAPAAQKHLEL